MRTTLAAAMAAPMLRIAAAAVVAAGVTVSPPAASASDAKFDCFFEAGRDSSGGPYQGFAHGFAVSPSGGTVAINCVILVNSAQVAQTGTQTGTPAAYTVSDISFWATEFDDIDICADVTDHGLTTRHCFQGQSQQIPSQVVYDTLDGALAQVRPVTDPRTCSLLARLKGTYGRVQVNSQGDVFVEGAAYYDCPPYDQRVADYPRVNWAYRS